MLEQKLIVKLLKDREQRILATDSNEILARKYSFNEGIKTCILLFVDYHKGIINPHYLKRLREEE